MKSLLACVLLSSLVLGCGDDDSSLADGGAVELTDPLSMPAQPTLDPEDFVSPSVCGGCHTQHYADWQTSMHSYSMVDPVYRALVQLRHEGLEGTEDRFCLQCHSPIASRTGEIQSGFSFDDLSEVALAGITCETCHKIASIERPYNAGFVIDGSGPIRGPIEDPVASGFHQKRVLSTFRRLQALCGLPRRYRE